MIISALYNRFGETGCVSHREPDRGRPCVVNEAIEIVRQTFVCNPRKSVTRTNYSKIWTEFSFFKKIGHLRSSIARWSIHSQGGCLIGHGGKISWPPRSIDLTPLDFPVCGYVKVFIPPLPASLEELRAQITEAGATMIHRIWDEIAYSCDICRLTRGNHIEHLWISVDKI
jgi:hypothetical protein